MLRVHETEDFCTVRQQSKTCLEEELLIFLRTNIKLKAARHSDLPSK